VYVSYCKELLAPRPSPKLEDRPLSAVRDCLFDIFAATLHIGGRASIRNVSTRRAVVTGTHLSWDHRQYQENLQVNAIKMSPKFCRLTFKNRASYILDGHTATLQMLHFIYIFSTNISTEYFKHAAHTPFFSSKCRLFHNATFFGSCIIHILHTGCAKI
jgi:hypothetical protein